MIATIEVVPTLSTQIVGFYSIRFEDKSQTEFEDFLRKHVLNSQYGEQLIEIRSWLTKIGKKGALKQYFKHEQKADALPVFYNCELENGEYGLRLYCIRWTENIVILLNGAEKTASKAQDCPQVLPHFRRANEIAKQLDEARRNKELECDHNSLIYDKTYYLDL